MKQYLNSFDARQTLTVGGKTYAYYSLPAAERNGLSSVSRIAVRPSKVIIENMLRNEDGCKHQQGRHRGCGALD